MEPDTTKIALITGASRRLGKNTALTLAKKELMSS
jgi:NAD(P)-dependent dehydrogenase (short-subunit alcohol dehydrogenase family)